MASDSGSDSLRRVLSFLALPAASALGFYGTVKLSKDNGLLDFMEQNVRKSPSFLPGLSSTPIQQWTGLRPVDMYFSYFVTFFWPVINSKDSIVQLQSRHFIGQFVALWTLLELEGVRSGNTWGTLLTGLAIQNLGAATTVPIFAAIQLARAKSARTPLKKGSGSVEESQRLRAIPIAQTLGVLIPLGLMSFSPSLPVKQLGIIIFQIYPIFTSLIIRAVAPLLPREATIKRKAGDALPGPLSTVYIFATVIATLSHVATLSEGFSKGLSFSQIFLPRLQLNKAGDMVDAALSFLQWDEAVSCGSLLLWALGRYVIDTAPARGISYGTVVQAALGATVRTVLMGPVGAAAELLRQREIAKV